RHSAAKLRELLARGNDLRIKDLKLMVKEFANQREKRLALQKNRKEEVAELPDRGLKVAARLCL
ncbi:MAG: hypothetical protein KKH28_01820, partial [Elusimicrobia bacterium]|nr:hypothetical protein [Elusimicrobiota bacterium]